MASKLYLKISIPWWVINTYIPSLIIFHNTLKIIGFDVEPNINKITEFIVSHVKYKMHTG